MLQGQKAFRLSAGKIRSFNFSQFVDVRTFFMWFTNKIWITNKNYKCLTFYRP